MIASAYRLDVDIAELRLRFGASGRGATLRELMSFASQVGLSPHAVKLDMAGLSSLRTPAVLHWDLDHFVVLERLRAGRMTIIDPALGRRTLSVNDASKHFTGIALQLSPSPAFNVQTSKPRLRLLTLLACASGLRSRVLQVLMTAFALECFGLAAPLANQLIVDEVLPSNDAELLTIVLVGFALLLLIQTALAAIRGWLVVVLSRDLNLQWSTGVLAHLLRLSPQYFERRHLGDIVTRFEAIQVIQKTLTGNALTAILDGIFAIAALGLMLAYSLKLTIVVLAAVVFYVLIRVASYETLSSVEAERMVLEAKQKSHFLESIRAIVPIKLFGRTSERISHWQSIAHETQDRETRSAGLNLFFTCASQLLVAAENLAVLGLGAQLIMSPESPDAPYTIGMLFAFVSYKDQFTRRVLDLVNCGVAIRMLGLQAERVGDIVLSAKEPHEEIGNSIEGPGRIELRDISYRYGVNEPWILQSFNLTIDPGECIAIVGPSGSGKTTLVKVLLSLLDPTAGEVLYGGTSIHRVGVHNYRQRIGVVMQDDVLVSGTIAGNVSFFDEREDPRKLERVCRAAGIHEDISRMPLGYRTLVGDLGSSLSGGQRQRLLLARALYREPAVIVLDEATSHLDLNNEGKVLAALKQLQATRIVIAHRPETIAACDRVIRLEARG